MIPSIIKLIISVAIPLLVGYVSGQFTQEAIPFWYEQLSAPSFRPPNGVFFPVWTVLYVLMGVSFFLVWDSAPSVQRGMAIRIYIVQLILNFSWSLVFFHWKQIGWALAVIVALWLFIYWMIVYFKKVKPIAGYLNIPYILWVSFATALNAAYFYLN